MTAPDKPADNGDAKGDDKGDEKPASKSAAVATIGGEPVLDFATYAEAEAQAKAIGKGASVEHVGVAFHVATSK